MGHLIRISEFAADFSNDLALPYVFARLVDCSRYGGDRPEAKAYLLVLNSRFAFKAPETGKKFCGKCVGSLPFNHVKKACIIRFASLCLGYVKSFISIEM